MFLQDKYDEITRVIFIKVISVEALCVCWNIIPDNIFRNICWNNVH